MTYSIYLHAGGGTASSCQSRLHVRVDVSAEGQRSDSDERASVSTPRVVCRLKGALHLPHLLVQTYKYWRIYEFKSTNTDGTNTDSTNTDTLL